MDLALSIVDVLRQIYELRDAIRRQRHVNRRTYLRMMEIYVELQSSDGIQTNATLQRTATLDKFSAAVTKFLLYLHKYNDMHKVVRMFKFAAMEEQRLKIVDEIDQLYRMLNLATAVAVMNGTAAAASNAARLFAKLEDMHGDIRLTHDQIHAALLADKQHLVVPRKRFLGDQEPGLERSAAGPVGVERILIRQAPILKKYAPAAAYAAKEKEEFDEKSPVSYAMKWGETKRSGATDDVEEDKKKVSVDVKAEVQSSMTDVVIGMKVQPVQKVELEGLTQTAAYDDEEEKESSNRQLTLVQEVAEEMGQEESKPNCEVPGLVRSPVGKVASEKEEDNNEPSDQQSVVTQDTVDEAIGAKDGEVGSASDGQQPSVTGALVEVKEEPEIDSTGEEKAKTSIEQSKVMQDADNDDTMYAEEPEPNDTNVQQSDEEVEILSTALQADSEEVEKNDPTTLLPVQDTADEAHEPRVEHSDILVQASDEVVEIVPSDSQADTSNEAVEEVKAMSTEQLFPGVGEMVDGSNQRSDENNEKDRSSIHDCALLSDMTDETDAEPDDFEPKTSTPVVLDHYSVALLIRRLGSDGTTTQQKEDILMDLLRICITHTNRAQVYKTKGIPVLKRLVYEGETFLTQLYALHCLSWFTFSFSKMRESEFDELQRCVREPTHAEMLSLLHELQSDDDEVIERAALKCSCMATGGVVDALRQVGALRLLIDLLKNGTANQKLWATEALLTLASDNDENCVAITRGGAIPLLVSLLRTGTDMNKQEAAYALGNLAANNEVNRAKIAREGAIPPMVEFVKSVTDAQNQWAVYALGFLSLNNEENRVLIAQEGAIRPLVDLLRTGKRGQKQWAAYTLGNLAHNDANREEITLEGAIAPLIKLLQTGTAMQKQRAAFALGNLACDNMAADFDDAILPLVDLVRMGSETQKEDAAYTLGNLAANNDARRAEIGRRGAIAPLVTLLKTGDGEQKQWAAFALRWLAYDNESNRAAIVKDGAIESLATIMKEGTEDQKEEAAHALEHLVVKNDATVNTIISDRIKAQLMGYFNTEAISQNANVAATAALNTLGTVREGVLPLFRRFVNADADAENESASNEAHAATKAGNKVGMAGAW